MFQSRAVEVDSDDKSAPITTCGIVTEPDSDIETDAVPDVPRPRGTPIPEPPKPRNSQENGSQSADRTSSKYSPKNHSKKGKKPEGWFKDKTPYFGGGNVINVCNSNNVHFGNTNIIYGAMQKPKYFSEKGEEIPPSNYESAKQKPKDFPEKEKEVPPSNFEILFTSTKTVDDGHLDCVADNIGKMWESLGKRLGLKESAIFRLESDYKENHREKVYQLLLEWKQSIGGQNRAALLSHLSAILWELRERDALDELVKLENDPRLQSL